MHLSKKLSIILICFIFYFENISFCIKKDLPTGWYSRGWIIDSNVDIYSSPKTGKIIGNTSSKEPEIFFCESLSTGEKYEWLKIRTTILDEKNGELKGIEGWIYGGHVQLNEYGNLFADGVLGAIKVMEDMPYFLGFNNASCSKEKDITGSELGVLSWADGFICKYTENSSEKLNSKPNKEGWGLVPVSFEITSNKFQFLGLNVGMESNYLKEFDSNLKKAGWKNKISNSEFNADSIYIWEKNDRQIKIEILDGKIIRILQCLF